MINELIEQIGGRKRLEQMSEDGEEGSFLDIEAMARALLAVLDAKPFAAIGDEMLEEMRNGRKTGRIWSLSQLGGMEPDCLDALYVYTTPPASSEPVSNGYKLPDGWKLVPIDPTWGMLSADGCSKHHDGQECSHHENRKRIWRSMLAAAPAPGGE